MTQITDKTMQMAFTTVSNRKRLGKTHRLYIATDTQSAPSPTVVNNSNISHDAYSLQKVKRSYLELCHEDVRDTADDGDEIKDIPVISEVVLNAGRKNRTKYSYTELLSPDGRSYIQNVQMSSANC